MTDVTNIVPIRIGSERERRGRHVVTTHKGGHVFASKKLPLRKTQHMLHVGPAGQRNQRLMVQHAQLDRYSIAQASRGSDPSGPQSRSLISRVHASRGCSSRLVPVREGLS